MIKSVIIEIDQSSWSPSGVPAFPIGFHNGVATSTIEMLSTLLVIGQLTTPPLAAGASLSEFWAWVRYVSAIADTPDVRLTTPFADLDSHQKTILSDDFGMGMPISWLIGSLGLVAWCDGRYFMKRFSALMATAQPTPKKSGPTKAPDFILEDAGGFLHVVECKGTQSGPTAREKQLYEVKKDGTLAGGTIQKTMVTILPPLTGQRLACGLVLVRDKAPSQTTIKIVDPEPQDGVTVTEKDEDFARDPIVRATLAKALRSCGLLATARAVASPSGLDASSKPFPGQLRRRSETRRRNIVAAQESAARDELARVEGRYLFERVETTFVGREMRFDLPQTLFVGGKRYGAVEIRQGISLDLAREIQERGLVDAPIMEGAPWLRERVHGIKTSDEGDEATLRIGDAYLAELKLVKSR
ncbi:MAG: hypothetical protein EOR97_12995 [Mesorhizobium sp.]|uniref:hypothetical protein n=1 Tax=Mesorhizobium sp. TaxID=1871066 RepID=UPI000FE716E9|nr:hypothetical protein [Mesorhizobium sp.]RWN31098.1 MAG: hypothetical protein EOR97_12995 [Mesorhizobium sp.]